MIPGNEAWTNVPILNWNRPNRKVNLNANWDDNHNWNYAVPVCRDYSNNLRGCGYRTLLVFEALNPAAQHAAYLMQVRLKL